MKKSTKKLTQEEFIKQSKVNQPKSFGYDLTVYINSSSPILVYCYEHKHYFTQIAASHKKGHIGCKDCIREVQSKSRRNFNKIDGVSRVCNKCGERKPLSEFSKKGFTKLGQRMYQTFCKECSNKVHKEIYYENRNKILKNKKEYYKKNKNKILQYNKDNFERRQRNYKEWYDNNQEYIIAKRKETSRTGEYRRTHAAWARERRKNDPNYALEQRLRNRTYSALKNNKNQKVCSTLNLLGITAKECVEYLNTEANNGYTFGDKGIEVDHIIPCAFFDLSDPIQQKICFNFRNLQLLTKKENLEKSDSLPENLNSLFSDIYKIVIKES